MRNYYDSFGRYGPVGMPVGDSSMFQARWNQVIFDGPGGHTDNSVFVVGRFPSEPFPDTAIQFAMFASFADGGTMEYRLPLDAIIGRIIGGFYVNTPLTAYVGCSCYDSGTAQFTIQINESGFVELRSGTTQGSIIATSVSPVAANADHYVAFDVTIGASASYSVWVDRNLVLTGTGNTRGGTGNNSVNMFGFIGSTTIDGTFTLANKLGHLYLFDATGSVNNAVILDARCDLLPVTGDSQAQFTFGAAILGPVYSGTTNTSAPGANTIALRKYTTVPAANMNRVSIVPEASNISAKFKAVVYADNAGAPGALIATGTEVIGCVAGATLVLPFGSPVALTGATAYWLGFITDTSIALAETDLNDLGYVAGNTYTSGAPNPAPSMTAGQPSWMIWGNLTGITTNWSELTWVPPAGDFSYVYSDTVGNEDLATVRPLNNTSTAIYSVKAWIYARKTDVGARTVDMRLNSSGTDNAGDAAGQNPLTSWGYLESYFAVDPHTGVAWLTGAVNAVLDGYAVAS